jgi:sterol desaturase/sphingolipid hydroxylase (fatty acid hydroxylase superfamily)
MFFRQPSRLYGFVDSHFAEETMTPETGYSILALILVLFLAAATAKAASDNGYSATLWFIAGVLLPGLALVLALFLDEQSFKECPRCVRRVDPGARICGYCGHDFTARGRLRVDNFR